MSLLGWDSLGGSTQTSEIVSRLIFQLKHQIVQRSFLRFASSEITWTKVTKMSGNAAQTLDARVTFLSSFT